MIAKTKFQAAVAAFVRRVADEAAGTLGPNGAAVIASVVEALIDLRNAEATLDRARRMAGVRPTGLAHLRLDVGRQRDAVGDVLAKWSDILGDVDPPRLLKMAETVLKAARQFVRVSFASLATDEDIAFVRDRPVLANDDLLAAVCNFICYDRSVPRAAQMRIWDGCVPVRQVPRCAISRAPPRCC